MGHHVSKFSSDTRQGSAITDLYVDNQRLVDLEINYQLVYGCRIVADTTEGN